METVQGLFNEYFVARRWFLHHVLIGLLVGLIAGAAIMWTVTNSYFSHTAEAAAGGTKTTTTTKTAR